LVQTKTKFIKQKVNTMSNNHSHDNIYSILGKLEALQPTTQEKHDATVQQIRESVEAQGSILKGLREVTSTEQRLARQFAESKKEKSHCSKCDCDPCECPTNESEETCNECGMYESECGCDHTNEGETTHKDGVTKHRKTDYPGYPSDDIDADDEDSGKSGKRGRPRKHAKKADTGEKKGRGRPKKDKPAEYDKRHDPFGRVKSTAHKSAEKVSEKAVSQAQQKFMGMVHAAQKGSKAASPEVAKVAKSMGKRDARDFAATKHKGLPQHVRESITESVNFKRMMEEQHMTLDEMLDSMSSDMKMFKETGVCSDRLRDMMEVFAHAKKQMEETRNDVAPSGIAKPNEFTVQTPSNPDPFAYVKDAPKPAAGIPGSLPPGQIPGKSALLKGQGRNYYEEEATMEAELNELARLAGLGEVSRGEYIKQQDANAEKSGKDKFQAFGQEFDTDDVDEELEQEGTLFTKGLEDDNVKIGDKIPGTNAIKTKDIDTVDEAKVDVADAPEAANKPKPKYQSIKAITTQGDDLNRQKRQFADKPKAGDNPMATLEAKLAEEYESIKKVN
jgi:hypothetical protein